VQDRDKTTRFSRKLSIGRALTFSTVPDYHGRGGLA
jgi:hypothetical protein